MTTDEKKKEYKKKHLEKVRKDTKMHRLMERIRKREQAAAWRTPPKSVGEFVVHKQMARQGWEDSIPNHRNGPIRMGV